MLAMGGGVRGGLYGNAASLDPNPSNPTLENGGGDVRYEIDFRSVYAKVLDGWLGVNSDIDSGGRLPRQRSGYHLAGLGSGRLQRLRGHHAPQIGALR